VVCVPNGIDLDEPIADDRRHGVHVIFLSSLFVWKGTHIFIEAFAAAARERQTLRATVAGSWPSAEARDETLALAAREGVLDRIAFAGVIEGRRKAALLRSGDIFCFASLVREGQPLVILEAMAAGLPVVSRDWPGIADTVVDGETGVLVRDGTPGAFADALVRLVDDESMRERMGVAGRERYTRLYTRRAFGERMVALFEPLLLDDMHPSV
jgi:glycosyltransferase involved in cell wall biosynthesis